MQYGLFLLVLRAGALAHKAHHVTHSTSLTPTQTPYIDFVPTTVSQDLQFYAAQQSAAAHDAATGNVTIAAYTDGFCTNVKGSIITLPGDGSCQSITNIDMTGNFGIFFNHTVDQVDFFGDDKCAQSPPSTVTDGFGRSTGGVRCWTMGTAMINTPVKCARAVSNQPQIYARSVSSEQPHYVEPKDHQRLEDGKSAAVISIHPRLIDPTRSATEHSAGEVASYTDLSCQNISNDKPTLIGKGCRQFAPKNDGIGVQWGQAKGLRFFKSTDCTGENFTFQPGTPKSTKDCFIMQDLNGGPYGSFEPYDPSSGALKPRELKRKHHGPAKPPKNVATIASYHDPNDYQCTIVDPGNGPTTINGTGDCQKWSDSLSLNFGIVWSSIASPTPAISNLQLYLDDNCTVLAMKADPSEDSGQIDCFSSQGINSIKANVNIEKRTLSEDTSNSHVEDPELASFKAAPQNHRRAALAFDLPPNRNLQPQKPKPEDPWTATYQDESCKETPDSENPYTDQACVNIAPGFTYFGINWGNQQGAIFYSETNCTIQILDANPKMMHGGPGSCFDISSMNDGPALSMSMYETKKKRRHLDQESDDVYEDDTSLILNREMGNPKIDPRPGVSPAKSPKVDPPKVDTATADQATQTWNPNIFNMLGY
ncbi:hypothetical protein P7C71_g5913, partial [Lecanoromycetidae sp. Uapishka_2]